MHVEHERACCNRPARALNNGAQVALNAMVHHEASQN
jgi:hypothetical protein